ncbi:hypothetical protein Slin15195_G041700 [Septoria linicola]|uniref:Mid2 domain-containing protein n=1 Tax=Septoria linicola TaxID=215465 RepID=A0A9Q9EGI5_9PEZI|nr:hypothetical protein Slin14017_G045210 [Septoria linicola]USW50851.1 hypothetical protein Slin15195_G041700 [Septoria linicola]
MANHGAGIATTTALGDFCSNFDWVTAFNACITCAEPAGLDDTFEVAVESLGLACGYEVRFLEPGDDGDDGSVSALPVPERPVSSEVVEIETQTVTAAPAPSETSGAEADATTTRAQDLPPSETATSSTGTTTQAVPTETNGSPNEVTSEGSSPAATSSPQPDSTGTPDVQSSSSSSSSGPNIGAIAGGVVGAVVGLALIAGVVVFFDRRKKKLRAREPEYMEPRVPEMQMFPSAEEGESGGGLPDQRYAVAKNF